MIWIAILWLGMTALPTGTRAEPTITFSSRSVTSNIVAEMDSHSVVKSVKEGSSLWKAGMRQGDQVISVSCEYVVNFRKAGETKERTVIVTEAHNDCR